VRGCERRIGPARDDSGEQEEEQNEPSDESPGSPVT